MAPSSRLTSGSKNGEDIVTKPYVDDAMTEIIPFFAAMNSTITTLSIQTNQVVNHDTERQAKPFGRLAKFEFPKFHGDDVRWGENVGWDKYKEAIIQRSSSVIEDPMVALKNAKYEKTAKARLV
ncbi:hypothetical protein Tco_0256600 [Tanacetum coccineum]